MSSKPVSQVMPSRGYIVKDRLSKEKTLFPQHRRRGSELFVIDSYWERKISFLRCNDTRYIGHASGRSGARVIGQHKPHFVFVVVCFCFY